MPNSNGVGRMSPNFGAGKGVSGNIYVVNAGDNNVKDDGRWPMADFFSTIASVSESAIDSST
jgi:hypothetical protein